jgi:hypothetical protein
MKKEGTILKVKSGYNPNSSSVGSIIPLFIYLFGVAGLLTVFISNLFQKTDKEIKNNKESLKPFTENNK